MQMEKIHMVMGRKQLGKSKWSTVMTQVLFLAKKPDKVKMKGYMKELKKVIEYFVVLFNPTSNTRKPR